jgi:hypothetical protein
MTYTQAVAAPEAHEVEPNDVFRENMRQAGILAVRDLERMVNECCVENPKAVKESIKINGRTVPEMCAYIVDFYTGRAAAMEQASRATKQ